MRKIGGLIALVLIALMVITGCDNSASSSNKDEEWLEFLSMIMASQPNADVTWYDPSSDEFTLSTANQVLGLAALVNRDDFSGRTINLASGTYDFTNIVSEVPSSIGSGDRDDVENAKAFAGTFNGNNAVIKGVDLSYLASASDSPVGSDGEDNAGVGFFGVVKGTSGSHAVVRDLTFEDCTLVSTSNTTGIAVGYAEYADISGITVRNCEVIGPQGVGAVVGRVYKGGTITDCRVENTAVKATADGTADYTDGGGSGNYNAGGIVGCVKGSSANTDITVSDNIVDLTAGEKRIYADYFTAGGICGTSSNATFSSNSVKVNSRDQIVVNDPVNAHEGAIVANASTNTGYGSSADVNSVEIDGTPHDVTDSSVDNINTIGI